MSSPDSPARPTPPTRGWRARLRRLPVFALTPALAMSLGGHATDGDFDGSAWDRARSQLTSQAQGPMAQAIAQWKMLTAGTRYGFAATAGFISSYPGFPEQDRLRRAAEAALDRSIKAGMVQRAILFDLRPPISHEIRLASTGKLPSPPSQPCT